MLRVFGEATTGRFSVDSSATDDEDDDDDIDGAAMSVVEVER